MLLSHFRSIVNPVNRDRATPAEQAWSGWIGRFNDAIEHARELISSRQRSAAVGRAD